MNSRNLEINIAIAKDKECDHKKPEEEEEEEETLVCLCDCQHLRAVHLFPTLSAGKYDSGQHKKKLFLCKMQQGSVLIIMKGTQAVVIFLLPDVFPPGYPKVFQPGAE